VSGRRKPRVVSMGQDITVVEAPPPGPPQYELMKSWPPSKPPRPRKTLRSRIPVIISSTALAVVIAVLITTPTLWHQLISFAALTTTVTSTHTTTEVKTVTVTAEPAILHENYIAWLKIVTDSWDGVTYPGYLTPVNPAGIDFPGRYNVTNVCVELYRFTNPTRQNPAPLTHFERRFAGSPNATGFIEISWPASWENVTVVVKAKSYKGECIGTENGRPFEGIIVYWLTFGRVSQSFYNKFIGNSTNPRPEPANYTIGDDGILIKHATDFNWSIRAPFGSGPVDVVLYNTGPITFQANHGSTRNAWVARAAYIFMLFHEHTWYSTKDNLTYATIFIYDTDHTRADSTKSLIQAAITGPDGQSRYTREITSSGKFANNSLVPIPLQTINLVQKRPFQGGISDLADQRGNIEAPHLNATKRVWWETVLTNQTFYVGNKYNGTRGYSTDLNTGITRPLFGAFPANPGVNPTTTRGGITGVPAGPLSLALNHTVPKTRGLDWVGKTVNNVASFGNNTVFYSRICVQFVKVNQRGEAEIVLKSRTSANITDYLLHGRYITGDDGCTKKDSSKWPGHMDEYENYIRFPNGTDWGGRGSLNASYFFIPINDISPAWGPKRYFMRASDVNWEDPYNNAGKNWSALVPEITYMMTRTLIDDPRWGGFEIQIKREGQVIDSVKIPNPYRSAYILSSWVKGTPLQDIPGEKNLVLIRVNP
jgi:hypothetical protein